MTIEMEAQSLEILDLLDALKKLPVALQQLAAALQARAALDMKAAARLSRVIAWLENAAQVAEPESDAEVVARVADILAAFESLRSGPPADVDGAIQVIEFAIAEPGTRDN